MKCLWLLVYAFITGCACCGSGGRRCRGKSHADRCRWAGSRNGQSSASGGRYSRAAFRADRCRWAGSEWAEQRFRQYQCGRCTAFGQAVSGGQDPKLGRNLFRTVCSVGKAGGRDRVFGEMILTEGIRKWRSTLF